MLSSSTKPRNNYKNQRLTLQQHFDNKLFLMFPPFSAVCSRLVLIHGEEGKIRNYASALLHRVTTDDANAE